MTEYDFENMGFKDIIEVIDANYLECKLNKRGRFSVEWGKFSTNMNTTLRLRMNDLEKEDKERDRYLCVFAYWICRSQLLDLYLKNKILSQGKIKRLKKEIKDYRRFIITGKNIPSTSQKQVLEKLLKRK